MFAIYFYKLTLMLVITGNGARFGMVFLDPLCYDLFVIITAPRCGTAIY